MRPASAILSAVIANPGFAQEDAGLNRKIKGVCRGGWAILAGKGTADLPRTLRTGAWSNSQNCRGIEGMSKS
jgi:hypothetical protein